MITNSINSKLKVWIQKRKKQLKRHHSPEKISSNTVVSAYDCEFDTQYTPIPTTPPTTTTTTTTTVVAATTTTATTQDNTTYSEISLMHLLTPKKENSFSDTAYHSFPTTPPHMAGFTPSSYGNTFNSAPHLPTFPFTPLSQPPMKHSNYSTHILCAIVLYHRKFDRMQL